MSRRAASLTGDLMVRKGAAGPSYLELAELADDHARRSRPTLVPPAQHRDKSKSTRKKAGETGEKRRFTLRLSDDQHLRMRLASVHLHMSSQQMVMIALDEYLAKTAPHIHGGCCDCVAGDESRGKTGPGKGGK